MPGPLDTLRNYFSPAGAGTTDSPYAPWQKTGQQLLEGGTDALLGLAGFGEETKANIGGQLAAAALPFGTGIKGLYSRVQRAAEELPAAFSSNRALQALRNQSSGEEMAYRKVPEFLRSAPKERVTKPELMQHLEQNPAPRVETRVLGEPSVIRSYPPPGGATKYSNYQVPGGSNYRETLLTLPQKQNEANEATRQRLLSRHAELDQQQQAAGQDIANRYGESQMDAVPSQEYHAIITPMRAEQRHIRNVLENLEIGERSGNFKSSHWDEPNVLAHVRHNERMLPATGPVPSDLLSDVSPAEYQTSKGSKGRFLEEVQSDWHQHGKKEGYTQPITQAQIDAAQSAHAQAEQARVDYVHANPDVIGANLGDFPEFDRLWENRTATEHQLNALLRPRATGVPDAPFKESWPDLALKQQVMDVAGNPDLNWLGFTSGKTQNERYDLSKQISKVHYDPQAKEFQAYDKDGTLVIDKILHPDELPGTIGEETAARLLATEPRPHPTNWLPEEGGVPNVHTLEGLDLQTGGEGMQEFYDRQLPRKLAKILKPFGGTVEQGALEGQRTMPPPLAYGPGRVYGAQGGEFATHPIASTYPRRYSESDAGDLAKVIYEQQFARTPKPQIPIWLAHLPPEMKAEILKKGLPLLSLMGLSQLPQATQPDPESALDSLRNTR